MTTAEMATNMIRGTERPEWLTEATFPFESRYIEIGGN